MPPVLHVDLPSHPARLTLEHLLSWQALIQLLRAFLQVVQLVIGFAADNRQMLVTDSAAQRALLSFFSFCFLELQAWPPFVAQT